MWCMKNKKYAGGGIDSILSCAVDSASLSYGSLCRQSSLVRAVCVNAHVRIWCSEASCHSGG